MTIKWTGSDKDKLAALERLVVLQSDLIEQLFGFADSTLRRMLALQRLLAESGTLPVGAVEARSQAMEQESTAEVKLNPTYDEFQRQRDVIRRLQEEDESPQT
jgi:hypothetical protein